MTTVIAAEGLTKRFGNTQALAGVDISADAGRVLALLGPNGAGKTTIVRILSTLLKPDGGHASVCGYDVVQDAVQVRQLLALTGQYASVDEELTGTENLIMICRLLGLSRAESRARSRQMLERFELADAASRAAKTFSGGMRRRLDLAASLLGRPEVLFLDEPTTGLDPRGRSQMWDTVRGVVAEIIGTAPDVAPNGLITAAIADPAMVPVVVRHLDDAGIVAAELTLRLPSLDEVFMTLTGHPAEDDVAASDNAETSDHGRAA
jgi:ABC-type multidrug transport system ATPase subunit